jgi:hypothetical protein
MRRRDWVAIASVVAVLFAGYCGAGWYAKRSVVARLAARGFEASVGGVGLRPSDVVFDDVRFSHPSGALTGELRRVRVSLGWSGVTRVSVTDGVVHVRGAIDDIHRIVVPKAQELPSEHQPRQALPLFAEGISLDWEKPLGDGSGISLSGLVVEREQGQLSVRAAELQGSGLGLSGRAEEVVARLQTPGLGVRLLQMKQGNVAVDWGQVPRAEAPPGAQVTSGAPSVPSNPALSWVSLSPGRGPKVRQLIARGVGSVARRLPPDGVLELKGVTLTLRQRDEALSIGPGLVYAKRDDDVVRMGFVSGNEANDSEFEISLQAPLGEGKVEGRIKGGPVTLATLGVRPGNFGLQEVERTKLTVDSQFTLSADGTRAEFSTRGDVDALAVQHERVAPYALTDISFGWSLEGSLGVDGSEFVVEDGRVSLGRVQAVSDIAFSRTADRLQLHADASIDAGSCANMFQALPEGAAPLLRGAHMNGDFRWHGGIDLDTDHLTETKATWNMRNRCRFSEIPEDANPEQFRTQFTLNVPDFDAQPLELRTGPGSLHWTPLQEMSPYMEAAVLTTEDGGFYHHHGFDSGAIEGAIKSNMESGKFTRGASTISMQLAKNLYLERDKYIARKIQEALLTMLLEQELSKREILELYLNVIEYGPGVYGIRKAAKHYFNSSPAELSVAQCFFLASILPKPKGQYFEDNGALSPSRARVVRHLLKVALGRERITPIDLQDGLAEELRFGVPHLASNPYRNADGSPLLDNFYRGGDHGENEIE